PVVGQVPHWSSIVQHTPLILAFGGLATKNGQVSSGGAGAHTMETWLRRAKEAGIEFVSITPLRSDAPDFLRAQWVPIRPNTDTALMLAMAHTLLTEARYDTDFVARYCTGFEPFRRYLLGLDDGIAKDAQWAAAITGVDADTIRELARRAAATRSMVTCAWSLQRAHHGEQPYWAAIVLAAMLGGIGLPGGGFGFGHGSTNGIGVPRVDVAGPQGPAPPHPPRAPRPGARAAHPLLNLRARDALQPRPPTPSPIRPAILRGRQSLPSPSRSQPTAARLAEAADGDRARELVDADRSPCRHRAAGHHHARAQRRRRLDPRHVHSRHAPRHRPDRRCEERLRYFPRAGAAARL